MGQAAMQDARNLSGDRRHQLGPDPRGSARGSLPCGRLCIPPALLGDSETRSPRRSTMALEFLLFQKKKIIIMSYSYCTVNIL